MFDEASEADMGLHFAKVGEELFDAAALPQRLEAVRPPDPNILRFILELHHPDEWGKHRKIDVPHNTIGSALKRCRETFHHLCNTRE